MIQKILKHKIISLMALALLVLIGVRLFSGGGQIVGAAGGNRPVYVEVGEATFGVMREVGLYYGSLTAAQRFSAAPRVGGVLKDLSVNIGDSVTSGQLIAQLDDDEFKIFRDQAAHNVGLAEAQFAEAEANLRLAQSDMARQSNLADKRIVSQSDFEAVENRLRQAEARLLVAESQLKAAKSSLADATLRLSYTRISAAWPEGDVRWIGERFADEGDLVTANTPLFSVVSLDPLLVVVDVIERDYPKIRVGQEAELSTRAWPGEVFKGRVARVAPVLSASSRQARVELEVANSDLRLKPGMFAEVVFIFKEVRDVWSVPQDVPFRRREGFVIFVADPESGTVRMVPVTLGLVDNGRVELVDASDPGGPVVFLGQHLLEDGMAYRLPERPDALAENESKSEAGTGPAENPSENPAGRLAAAREAAAGASPKPQAGSGL